MICTGTYFDIDSINNRQTQIGAECIISAWLLDLVAPDVSIAVLKQCFCLFLIMPTFNTGKTTFSVAAACSIPIIFFISRYFVNKYPTLLHKKKEMGPLGERQLIGHRGSRLEGLPENSLAAFKDASKVAHILELDVWLTKDNEVIVHHDDTFHRMTDGSHAHKVNELHFHELPTLVPPHQQRHRLHEYLHEECCRIPTLEQLLASLPDDMHLIIEFKQDSDVLIEKVHQLLEKYDRLGLGTGHSDANCAGVGDVGDVAMNGNSNDSNVDSHLDISQDNKRLMDTATLQPPKDYWFSLEEKLNRKLYARDPRIPRITSVAGSMRVLFLHLLGVLPFMPIDEAAYGTDISHIGPKELQGKLRHVGKVPDWLFNLFLYLLRPSPDDPNGPPALLLQHSLHEHLRSRGIPIIFMGVNTPKMLHTCIECGATAALSDNITTVSEYLSMHPELRFKKIE